MLAVAMFASNSTLHIIINLNILYTFSATAFRISDLNMNLEMSERIKKVSKYLMRIE